MPAILALDIDRRSETASHVVFYRITADGILIVRILHQRMDFPRHL